MAIKWIRKAAVALSSLEVWIVGASVLASAVFPRGLGWAVGIGLGFWLVRWVAHGQLTVRTPADIGILGLLLTLPVSLWATALPEKTSLQALRLVSGILLFYAVINWAGSEGRTRSLALSFSAAGLALALFSAVSVEWAFGKVTLIPPTTYDPFRVWVSDTVHPNVLAGNLVLFLPVVAGLTLFGWKEWRGWQRLFLSGGTLLMIASLVLSQSRAGLVAGVVALGMVVALRSLWGWLLIPAASLGLGISIYLWRVERMLEVLSSGLTLNGLDGRLEVWSRAIYMIQDFPITGVGMGSFMEVADRLYPFFLAEPGSIEHAHNLFLQVAVDLGIPGLIAWGSILLVGLYAAWRMYRNGQRLGPCWLAGLGAGCLGAQIAMAVHGIFDAVVWGMVRPAPIVWGLWGLVMAGQIGYRKADDIMEVCDI